VSSKFIVNLSSKIIKSSRLILIRMDLKKTVLSWSLFEYYSDENIESGETDELRIIPLAYASLIDSEC